VFAHTFVVEACEAAIVNLVESLKLVQERVEHPGAAPG